jgi:CRISPR-associated Cas5-like protein
MTRTTSPRLLTKNYRSIATTLTVAALLIAVGSGCKAIGQEIPDSTISVHANQPCGTVGPLMFGSCIEDVNHEIYGGLYDQKLFGESFEEPTSTMIEGWTKYQGSWNCSDGVCTVDSWPGAKLVSDDAALTDCSAETDVRFQDINGDNAGLLVHVQNASSGEDNFDGYEVSLSLLHQQVILGKHLHNWRALQNAPVNVEPSIWIHLRVQLVGARILVYVGNNAVPVIDYTDGDNPLMSGSIALRTWNSNAAFRNVSVTTSARTYRLPLLSAVNGAVSGAWDAISTGNASASFLQDGDRPFNGKFSQMIERSSGNGVVGIANSGLDRWGISGVIGHSLQGRIYLRGENLRSAVTVALQSADGIRTYASAKIGPVTKNWTRYDFTLKPSASDPHSRFAIWIDAPGKLWVDQATLMDSPPDRFHRLPVREDIAKSILNGGITFMRYGGTMVNAPEYRWKKMIGDPDRRPPYNGHWYPYSSNGFGIFDFLNFCEAAHIHSAFAINCEETDQDVADLADYLT